MLDTGGYVHDAIDLYYKHCYMQEAEEYEDILYNTYSNLVDIWDITLPNEEFEKGFRSLENHSKWEYNNLKKGYCTKPLTELDIKIGGLRGIIDYINFETNMVIDWKTNKSAVLSQTYRIQAEFYKRVYEKTYKKELTHFYFFFLYPNEWRIVKYADKKQQKVVEEVDELLNNLKTSLELNKFEKQPRTKNGCDSCLYKYYCKRGI